jgi:hypothetical protein
MGNNNNLPLESDFKKDFESWKQLGNETAVEAL